jgi:O-antigen ligase
MRPHTALPVILLAVPMASMPLWPAFMTFTGQTPPGVSIVPTPLAIADLAFCIIASFVAIVLLARDRALVAPLTRPLLAYVGSWVLAAALGLDPITGLWMTLGLAMGIVFATAINAWYGLPRVAGAIFAALLASGTFVSLLGIAMVVLRKPALLYAMVLGRATSTFIVPGEFAGYLLLLIATALGIAAVTTSRFLRVLAVLAILSGSLALVLSYSRAGWLGAAVGAAFYIGIRLHEKLWNGYRSILAAAAGTGGVVAVGVAALLNGHHNPSEEFVRLPIWVSGLRTVELFPLTGIGPGAYYYAYPLVRPLLSLPTSFHAHNLLLTSFAETGLVGFAALIALWWMFVRTARAELRGAAPTHRTLALAIMAGLLATWTQGVFDFVQVLVLGCWLPFMSLALATARRGLAEP